MAALISAEHQGKVRAEDISDAFNQLAEEFLGTHPNPADPATLTRFIHEVAGFRGNTDDYYDPANSYIDRVLSSKRGIPISLALVHLCLAERIGLEAWGINFPGHVLVGYQGLDQAYVDPFSGRYLSCRTARRYSNKISGQGRRLVITILERHHPGPSCCGSLKISNRSIGDCGTGPSLSVA